MMIRRDAKTSLQALAGLYAVVVLTGPRQSGKSTLARDAFPEKPYVSLEDPDTRDYATQDTRHFLGQFPQGAILDEVQRCPAIFSYLQGMVDADPASGRFLLTGSQQFGLMSGVNQSLAGRAGFMQLLPFTLDEVMQLSPPDSLEALLLAGLYPPIHDRQLPPAVWYSDYIASYIERDVRQMVNVRDLSAFQRFLRMCAARTGQVLNLSALAGDCGITHNTAAAWLSVLEASYIVVRLPPYFRNFGKRLSKTPKLYFLDTGLAAVLAGIRSADALAHSAMRGPLFETWVVTEALKRNFNRVLNTPLYYWRDSNGQEMDLVIEQDEHTRPLECKSGTTLAVDWFRPVERYLDLSGAEQGWLLYGGDAAQLRNRVQVHGWRTVGAALDAWMGAGYPLAGKGDRDNVFQSC